MDFSDALMALKSGDSISRKGWNGKDMYLFLVEGATFKDEDEKMQPLAPFIAMWTADGKMVPWLASQTDLLASDWEVTEDE